LPSNEWLELVDEVVRIGVRSFAWIHVVFPWIMFREKGQKLFHIVFAVLVIKVDDESDWSDCENLHFFGFAVNLQVSNEIVLGRYFFIELKVVDKSFLGIREHFFIVVTLLGEKPLEIGNLLPRLDLFPDFS
jgi:hypothetical protein